MKTMLMITAFVGLIALGTTHAAGNAEAGKAKSVTCAACHGVDGNSAAPNFPKLAGQHADYLYKQLKQYKSGDRKNAVMAGMVAALNDEDMANLAAYYSAQQPTIGIAAEDQIKLGESIYRAGNTASGVSACAACHGPNGVGNPMANFPRLSGQHALYTAEQLKYFRSGTRANDAASMMRSIAKRMTDEEIEAVSQYVQGLQ
ncbi:MAG: c-type cytochrome [Sedimenticolaceae bacterium]